LLCLYCCFGLTLCLYCCFGLSLCLYCCFGLPLCWSTVLFVLLFWSNAVFVLLFWSNVVLVLLFWPTLVFIVLFCLTVVSVLLFWPTVVLWCVSRSSVYSNISSNSGILYLTYKVIGIHLINMYREMLVLYILCYLFISLVRPIDFASVSIKLWNCSDSVYFFLLCRMQFPVKIYQYQVCKQWTEKIKYTFGKIK
jgi:hypothetical protein